MTLSVVALDLGCGPNKRPDAVGVDARMLRGVDVVADLASTLPFRSRSIGRIYLSHVLEHLDSPLDVLAEVHRVLALDGVAVIEVPHFSNPYAHSDPTHRSLWGIYSLAYLTPVDAQPFRRKVPDTYVTRYFDIVEVTLVPMSRHRLSPMRALDAIFRSAPRRIEVWERYLSRLYPMYAVRTTIRVRSSEPRRGPVRRHVDDAG